MGEGKEEERRKEKKSREKTVGKEDIGLAKGKRGGIGRNS